LTESNLGIPKSMFTSDDPRGGFGALYPKRNAARYVIDFVCDFMDVSRTQLGRWLDTGDPNAIHVWYHNRKRPSPVYLARMLALVGLKDKGIDLSKVRYIDWETGEARGHSRDPSPHEMQRVREEMRKELRRDRTRTLPPWMDKRNQWTPRRKKPKSRIIYPP